MIGGRRVAVTGLGILSPLGLGVDANAQEVFNGRDAVAPVTRFDTAGLRCNVAAQISDEWVEPPPQRGRRWHRSSMIVASAMREACRSAGSTFVPDIAIVGTTSGGMSFGEEFFTAIRQNRISRSTRHLPTNYMPGKAVGDGLSVCGLNAPVHVVATACASGADAIGLAMDRIRCGRSRMILAGGYDLLSELVFAGFDSLQALTVERCRPFDVGRSGLVLGEAAAFVALESFESAQERGAEILCEAAGYGAATDTHHPTQPEPGGRGPCLAMSRALRNADMDAAQIDYVNAHGTATVHNDNAEAAAFGNLFGERAEPVRVSSSKGMTGHTLGAAGAIEAVFSILALRENRLPPNINHRTVDPEWKFRVIANRAENAQADSVLSNSLGFAGSNASLIFRKLRE